MASPVRRFVMLPLLRQTCARVSVRSMASVAYARNRSSQLDRRTHLPRLFPAFAGKSPGHGAVTLRMTSSAAQTPGQTSGGGTTVRKMTPEEGALSYRMVAETLESPELDDALHKFAIDAEAQSLPTDRARLFQLIRAWQRALTLAQSVQMEAISRLGFEASPAGLLSYERQLAKLIAVGKTTSQADELTSLRRRKWTAMLKRCFDIDGELTTMSVDEARLATRALADAVQDEAFVECLRNKMDAMSATTSSAGERRAVAVEDVLAAHGDVLARLGFAGESGYMRFQAAVTDHVIDAEVAENLAAATSSVLKLAER